MTRLIPARQFTYATEEISSWRRAVIRGIEFVSGKPKLHRMYEDYCRGPEAADFFGEAVARLNLQVEVDGPGANAIPAEGPLVIVANHPFGVVDGIVLGYLISRARPDFKILVHSVLYRLPELQPNLLPIDFSETPEALRINLETRRTALGDLDAGRAIAIFPGGGVSSAPNAAGRAMDPEWKTFVARLIQAKRATVLPVYFDGQNSRLFQLASVFSLTLRMSLLFREVVNKIGTEVRVQIGEPIPHEALAEFENRRDLVDHLRKVTYALDTRPRPEKRKLIQRIADAGKKVAA